MHGCVNCQQKLTKPAAQLCAGVPHLLLFAETHLLYCLLQEAQSQYVLSIAQLQVAMQHLTQSFMHVYLMLLHGSGQCTYWRQLYVLELLQRYEL
jgi:hypothetical protein